MIRPKLTVDSQGNLRDMAGEVWAMRDDTWNPATPAPRVLALSAQPSSADDTQWAAWSPAASAEFLGRCDHADAAFRSAGKILCILPRAIDPLSDVPGVLSLLRQRGTSNVRVVLDPALLLVPSMLATAQDHLARAILSIGNMPGLEAILLRNVRQAEDGTLVPSPIADGVLDPQWLLEPARQLPQGVPFATLPQDSALLSSQPD